MSNSLPCSAAIDPHSQLAVHQHSIPITTRHHHGRTPCCMTIKHNYRTVYTRVENSARMLMLMWQWERARKWLGGNGREYIIPYPIQSRLISPRSACYWKKDWHWRKAKIRDTPQPQESCSRRQANDSVTCRRRPQCSI